VLDSRLPSDVLNAGEVLGEKRLLLGRVEPQGFHPPRVIEHCVVEVVQQTLSQSAPFVRVVELGRLESVIVARSEKRLLDLVDVIP